MIKEIANKPNIIFAHPFIHPPKKYHIKRNAISSITLFNIRQEIFNFVSFDDNK